MSFSLVLNLSIPQKKKKIKINTIKEKLEKEKSDLLEKGKGKREAYYRDRAVGINQTRHKPESGFRIIFQPFENLFRHILNPSH